SDNAGKRAGRHPVAARHRCRWSRRQRSFESSKADARWQSARSIAWIRPLRSNSASSRGNPAETRQITLDTRGRCRDANWPCPRETIGFWACHSVSCEETLFGRRMADVTGDQEIQVCLAAAQDLGEWQRYVDSMPNGGCMHHFGWYGVLRDAYWVTPYFLM